MDFCWLSVFDGPLWFYRNVSPPKNTLLWLLVSQLIDGMQ